MSIDVRAEGLAATGPSAAERRLRAAADRRSGGGGIPSRQSADAPLSAAQRGVWIADAMLGNSGVYNLSHLVWLRGGLDPVRLRAALGAIVERHEILRTVFAGVDDPRQVVRAADGFELPLHDLEVLPEARRRAEAMRVAQAEAGRSFDPTEGPLFRAALIRVDAGTHLLVLSMHHLLADEWALGNLIAEANAFYNGAAVGDLAIQYGDFAAWQVARLADGLADRQLAYWREALADLPHTLDLPTDRPRGARPSHVGHRRALRLTAEEASAFRRLAADHGVTAFSAMTAVFALVLARHAGQRRFAFGTAVSARSRVETEPLIGLFANTVAIPLDVAPEAPADRLLRAVHASVVEALDHQDVAFDRVLGELGVPRSMGRHPVCQVLVQWAEDAAGGGWRLAGVEAEPVTLGHGSAKADVTLVGVGGGVGGADGIEFEIICERDLFEPETAELLLGHFATALRHLAARPATLVGDVPLATAEEQRRRETEWRGSLGDLALDATIPQLFDEIVARQPDAPALTSGDGATTLSYAELDAAADQLADRLRRLGTTVDACVGVAVARSVDMVVAMVAIAKAGGACLPLDPANPAERNALLIAERDPAVVIAGHAWQAALGDAAAGRAVIVLDDEGGRGRVTEEVRPEARTTTATTTASASATGSSLAHVCYTSGSTGTPKGVGITHRGIVRLTRGHHPAVYGPGQTAVLLAPIAFDVSLIELWGSLLNGARLVVPEPGRLDIPVVADLLRRHGITTLILITPVFHQIVQGDVDALAGVRHLLVGGDSMAAAALTTALRALPDLQVIACYGPTENTGITTSIDYVDPASVGTRVPIGRPTPHSTVHVLDEALRPVPAGVVGELYSGGHGLARGYLGHPAATAQRFLPDPFSAVPGARMYRTGDLVRWRTDGMLDFVGRIDGQVKIRGFRIELGEIETRLALHPGVAEAAVVARPDADGHKRLIAYIVAPPGARAPGAAEAKRFIQQALPEYMTPSAIVVLDRMPLTAHAKLDRDALPDPAGLPDSVAADRTAPRTAVEEILAGIWSRVLGVPEVGVHDGFFDLGGDSIQSIRIASEARRAGLVLASADIFDHPTIAELAETSVGSGPSGPAVDPDRGPAVDPEQGPVVGEVPLTPVQHWFTRQDYANGRFNQAVRLAWDTEPDPAALAGALDALLAHHDALRLRLTRSDGVWQQRVEAEEAENVLEVIDLDDTAPGDQEAAILAAAARAQDTISAADGPLVRAVLFRGAEAGPQLVLAIHHLAVDTVSWGILLEDLATAHADVAAGRQPSLPAKTTSFQRWSKALSAHARSAGFDAEAAFWADYLVGDDDEGRLPADRPAGSNTVADEATVGVDLTEDETSALLRRMPAAHGAQAVEVLLTALATTLSGWTGAAAHVIDLEGHGREPVVPDAGLDVSRTVGWFTALHPVRLEPPASDDPVERLTAVRDQLRSIPHKGVGYGMARYLRGGVDGGDVPPSPARLVFNYHGQIAAGAGGADGAVRRLRAPAGPEIQGTALRPYRLEVTAAVVAGSLRVTWTYSSAQYDAATVASLADACRTELRALIATTTTTEIRR
ncbi:non-ribosomal peptide synthase domain TIGR01720/amino acid adenylation domain-containing protein [Parafrankia irregularis]|uniref:Non-ribosomal peptide synthase domain TIGR01720/amino acid adenylation domain-containing protein n=1 Tax=Parafrankia irregularis TaxID=795642 RepID=A0A0S4QX34_9ACTN|nr:MULTISPECIES: non-ribosomal peptide synthetase [Parafrankia]MBE3205756.1 amino acid adenylation domain-containing protein [Parafrankia sp. CH37]CUU59630.1 non-ribosomal peptide synthase domain TIGR01720/amino acid adenylation domain-containing protein [Parafrankia irregularis]